MYSTTGLGSQRFAYLAWNLATLPKAKRIWPPALGLRKSLKATLIHLRRNRNQDDIAEALESSQPTIIRAIATMIPLLTAVLTNITPAAGYLDANGTY
ncbi:hypothetical protein [Brevibacterium aurantiacum]|uniref:Uncharacterized protein n=1 Tax=Brevibacterium aurantiacum TaxID=273384 RepID=A0A2A3Z1W6_BREAU|nr:hypothetical protein [Brevibacterium aurantiacum]PCC45509.1 hypothetical protein CIK64_15350 [Brevibacterium aurantiacum]